MDDQYFEYEQENGMPEDWRTNVIYERTACGDVVRIDIPDDEEGKADARDDSI